MVQFSFLFAILFLAGCSFSERTTREYLEDAGKKSYDIIVVPGVPLENGKWTLTMKARVYWSKYLFDRGIAKNVMYSGSAVYTPYVEAEVMARYAEAIGIPREHIFTESKAEHSTENIYYSYKKARKLKFKTIALASDPFQCKMLKSFVRRRVSKDVDLVPIVFDTLRVMEPFMKEPQLDFTTIKVSNFKPLTERESAWQRFRGSLGKNINPVAYD